MSRWPSVTRCLAAAVAAAVLALSACGGGEPPQAGAEPGPGQQRRAPAAVDDIDAEIFPHAPAQMPAEGLEPDGRLAPWAMGAQIGATLHALAEACGQHGQAQLQDMQDEQRQAMTDQGVDMDRFDAVWTWAYRQARQKITMQPQAELARGCDSLREMEREADRMREMMQQMALPPSAG